MTQAADEGAVRTSRDGDVLRVVLDRPSRRNSLSHAMTDAFVDVLTDAATDESLRAIHIQGAGDDFCAGADWVATNSGGGRPRTGDLVRRIPHTANRIIELVHSIHLPVVCSVRGWAVGLGCNLALAADFTVAADDAVFWEPFVTRGFSPDSGSTWLLPRLAGLARAKEMLLLGEKISATDAAEWGLIHRCVQSADLDDTAAAAGSTLGLRTHRGHRTGQASHPPRPARLADRGDDPGTLQRGTVLSHHRFQGGSGGVSREAPAGVQWPMTGILGR